MKRILLSFIVCIIVSQIQAETLKILLDCNKSTVSIVLKGETYEKGEFLPANVQIDKVLIKEIAKLEEAQSHKLTIDNTPIKLGTGEAKLSEENEWNIEPFTTQNNNLVSVYRNNVLCGVFRVEITEQELNDNIKIFINDSLKDIRLDDKTEKLVAIDIKNDQEYPIENWSVKCGEKEIECNERDNKLVFKISYDDIKDDSANVVVAYNIKGLSTLKSKEVPILVAHKIGKANDRLYLAYLLIPILFVTLFFIMYLRKKRKWRDNGKKFTAINNEEFSILCSDIPTIGDVGNKIGKFETYDGYVYEFVRDHFWSKILLRSIWIRIVAKNGSSFFVDSENISCDSPRGIYILPNNKNLPIGKNTRAKNEGDYELDNGYIFAIRNGHVDNIKLKLKDKRNQILIIVLQTDSPQIGDRIECGNSPRYEMTDGTIYEISKHKIVNISHKGSGSKEIVLYDKFGKALTIYPKKEFASIGDLAVPNGEFASVDGKVFLVEDGTIVNIFEKQEESTEELLLALKQAQNRILELEKRPTQEAHEELTRQLNNALQKNKENEIKLADVDKAIQSAAKQAREEEKKKVESQYRIKISEEYISIASYKSEKSTLERQKEDAIKAKNKAEDKVKIKEGEIKTANEKITSLETEKKTQSELIIRLKASMSKMKESAQKKNVHYLIQIQEALSDISEMFKDVYKDIDDATIKDGLITPMVKGVSGLSAGILSWSEDFSVKVLGDSEAFFGSDYLTLSENEVKEQLSKKFVSNIVKSDSFSKFVRLYQLSTVPFIRKQLIDAKMNVDTLNTLYYKVYTLITDFGYTIICPRLFEEQHSDSKYQWFNSTNLFNIISLPEAERAKIKENGPETIIDINQIGFESPWASRKATAVTPDF